MDHSHKQGVDLRLLKGAQRGRQRGRRTYPPDPRPPATHAAPPQRAARPVEARGGGQASTGGAQRGGEGLGGRGTARVRPSALALRSKALHSKALRRTERRRRMVHDLTA